MKTYICVITSLFLSNIVYAKTYTCTFTHEQQREQLELKVKKSISTTNIELNGKEYTYNNCKTQKDQFGTLIDCNSGLTDFMILLDEKNKPTSGGIMSSTHELFVDLKC